MGDLVDSPDRERERDRKRRRRKWEEEGERGYMKSSFVGSGPAIVVVACGLRRS